MAVSDRERWDAKYRARGAQSRPHATFLERIAEHLPGAGPALDLAGGDGRNALWLAARGLEVTICDVSPVGLAHARALAAARGLAPETLACDLERDPLPRTASGWALVFSFHYLQRELLARIPEVLAPGGVFAFAQPTLRNLERHAHPSARFLLEEGELARLVPPGLEALLLEEGWGEGERHEARCVLRKPPTDRSTDDPG